MKKYGWETAEKRFLLIGPPVNKGQKLFSKYIWVSKDAELYILYISEYQLTSLVAKCP
jgi:hypothetical protein